MQLWVLVNIWVGLPRSDAPCSACRPMDPSPPSLCILPIPLLCKAFLVFILPIGIHFSIGTVIEPILFGRQMVRSAASETPSST